MSTTLPTSRYSTDVFLSLVVGERTIALSQVAPDFVVLKDPTDLPPSEGQVHVSVDGHVHRRHVFLIDGIQPSKPLTRIETLEID